MPTRWLEAGTAATRSARVSTPVCIAASVAMTEDVSDHSRPQSTSVRAGVVAPNRRKGSSAHTSSGS